MKKFLKVLATAAAVAAVVPFRGEGDEKGGELEGLLWKATWTRDPEHKTESDINITFGFNNPLKLFNKEADLFADDLVVDYCCDGKTVTYTDDCTCGEECACEETPAVEPVEETQTECSCGEECTDKE